MQILSLGQIISLAKALKKTIVCSLSCQSLKVTRLWMLIFFISEMVFSEKSDSCPQSQRKDDGNSSTAILHTRINPTKCYHTLWNGTDGYGIFQLLILPQLIDAIAKGKRENRECVYQFVAPDDERDSIFRQWLNRDEVFLSELVSVSNNISTTTPVIDTTPQDIPQTLTPVESSTVQGWKGLKLKLQQGLDSAGQFYQQLVSTIGNAIGVADGEPYWNAYLGQWQVWVNFGSGCTSVVCDWLVGV
ncbi:hypothetical protein [Nostoc sphaeroides]|uniref:Uncharacterized protein n=1 Tax=Nostoc sphaeroides CCNUC1 TaxID=2653204 RepID=A0A5P8WGY8_9NOSO|nr:hypothetical protein [Nostoc sphaeroides]QFS51426.1 hypothetical protein GXM_08920 [Nostoc sphaeroides CCNUC1]